MASMGKQQNAHVISAFILYIIYYLYSQHLTKLLGKLENNNNNKKYLCPASLPMSF